MNHLNLKMNSKEILFEIKCKACKKHFLYHPRQGQDFRCYNCRKGTALEKVEKELSEMSKEEYDSFMQDIEEYKEELRKKKENKE